MSCLNLDIDYFRHPRTLRLRARLGPGAELLPLELWCHCARYHPEDGLLDGYSAQELETACGWHGAPGAAAKALLDTGFVQEGPGAQYRIPGWLQEQGHIAAFKKRARAAALKRWGDMPKAIRPQEPPPQADFAPQTAARAEEPEPADACGTASGDACGNASGDACGNAPAVPYHPKQIHASDIANKSMARVSPENRKKLVECYKTFRGIEPGSGWDGQNLERNLRAADSLLQAFAGSLHPAAQWLCGFGEKMDACGLCWTLDTAARHAWDSRGAQKPPPAQNP